MPVGQGLGGKGHTPWLYNKEACEGHSGIARVKTEMCLSVLV